MFKGKLISNKKVNFIQQSGILGIISICLLSCFQIQSFGIWYSIFLTVVFVIVMYYLFKTKKLHLSFNSDLIEISPKEILLKTKKGEVKESIEINEQSDLVVRSEYRLLDKVGDLKEENSNFIIVQNGGEERRFDFNIDSHYMSKQLNKIVEMWKTKGFLLTYV